MSVVMDWMAQQALRWQPIEVEIRSTGNATPAQLAQRRRRDEKSKAVQGLGRLLASGDGPWNCTQIRQVLGITPWEARTVADAGELRGLLIRRKDHLGRYRWVKAA